MVSFREFEGGTLETPFLRDKSFNKSSNFSRPFLTFIFTISLLKGF